MDNRPYPLEGVTVIDLGQVYQGINPEPLGT